MIVADDIHVQDVHGVVEDVSEFNALCGVPEIDDDQCIWVGGADRADDVADPVGRMLAGPEWGPLPSPSASDDSGSNKSDEDDSDHSWLSGYDAAQAEP